MTSTHSFINNEGVYHIKRNSPVVSYEMVEFLFRKSYCEFKGFFPNEEPFIKVLCCRKRRFDRPELKRPWRKTVVTDDKVESIDMDPIEETVYRDRWISKKQSINVSKYKKDLDPNYVNNTIHQAERENRYDKISEKVIADRVIERKVQCDEFEAEITIHSQIPSNDNLMLIRNQDIYIMTQIESLQKMTSEAVCIEATNITGRLEQINEIFEGIKKKKEEIESFKKSVEEERRILTSIIENLTTETEDLKKEIKQQSVTLAGSSERFESLQKRISKMIGGGKTIEEICDGYFSIMKKLNDVKAFIPKYLIDHDIIFDMESSIKERGFVLSLMELLKHMGEYMEFQTGDSDNDFI
jgi:hypothetical protein